jgi:predicted MFS family arabinose efflux permease
MLTDNWEILLLARFLIGVGSGVAFLAVVKVTKTYFDKKHHSMMIALAFTFGLTGAVFGATPMRIIFDSYGYDLTFQYLSISALILAFFMLLMGGGASKYSFQTKEVQTDPQTKEIYKITDELKSIILNPKIIIIAISGALLVGSLEGFADVWAIPYFNQVLGASRNDSTTITSFVYVGMCFGGPILSLVARLFGSSNFTICIISILTTVLFVYLFYVEELSFIFASILMFGLGILCCYQVLIFVVASEYASAKSAGLAIAIANSINMSFGHFFHSIIGNMLQSHWSGLQNEEGLAIYVRGDFIYAISVKTIACVICFFGFAYLTKISNKNPA